MRSGAEISSVMGMVGVAGLVLAACAEPAPSGSGSAGGDGSSSSGGEPGSTGDPDATTGDPDSGSSGGPVDGYPPEVLDVLDLPWPPHVYDPPLPAHFQTPAVLALDNTPPDNPITDPGATLGRVLFYDPALSLDETISCSSCHPQVHGFADPAELSEGFEGGLTGRNSMGIVNARFYATGRFFWDERAATLEDQVLRPIQDPVEMGMTLDGLVARLQARPYYPVLFEHAFGDPGIDADRISRALAQFVRSITSHRSPYDEGLAAVGGDPLVDFPNLTTEENLGKQVFFGVGNCAPCHLGQQGEPLPPGVPPPNAAIFMLVAPANNGIDVALVGEDNGVGDEVGDPAFNGLFKSPSLRNSALTAPYMHDGRFETLAHVIQHYDTGVLPHPNLDLRLKDPDGQPQRLNLQTIEKQALQQFLGTLTDTAMIEDPRFSDPFRE
jgi:cytochrome c peroxidase